jgi:hypothetical protein
MTTRQKAEVRLHCPIPGCNSTFGRKADLSRHEGEKHGDMKFCSQPGCNYPGTKRAARLKEHMEKKHPDLYDGLSTVFSSFILSFVVLTRLDSTDICTNARFIWLTAFSS